MAVIEALSAEALSSEKIAPKPSVLETALSSGYAPFAVTAFFLVVLAIWTTLDHSLPVHDAAWHSTYSSTIKQWLCRPRSWSWDSLHAILTMQPNYPIGTWFFNGVCKLFVGDSLWSERAILAIHLCILNASSWLTANMLLKDRLKATLTIIFLNCCPLILGLSHISYIDLPQTALFGAYLAGLVWWWQRRSWKSALVCGLLFGLQATTKQIAVLYSVPSLALLTAILLYRRDWKGLAQMGLIGSCGAAYLASWVIPNFDELVNYTHNRHNFATARIGALPGICRAMTAAAPMVLQSFSPLMAILLLTLSAFKIKVADLKAMWLAIFAPVTGALLLVTATYFAYPEPRYFGPVMITLSMLLAIGAGALCRESKKGPTLVLASVAVCTLQALLLCFQAAPVVTHPKVKNLSPVIAWAGMGDPFLTCKIPYTAAGDPWKREWMFRVIEEEEKGRPVYLNVMENNPEFNQGTLLCLSRLRHSCVSPTTWRGNYNMPDVSDSFIAGDKELHFMQWVFIKTGAEQYVPWFDERSKQNYDEIVQKLQHSGLFLEAGRQPLPDGTELVLYQNKFWKFQRTAPASAPGVQSESGNKRI